MQSADWPDAIGKNMKTDELENEMSMLSPISSCDPNYPGGGACKLQGN